MKLAKVIYLILFLVIILSCREEKAEHATEAGEDVESTEEVFINYDENFHSIYAAKNISDFNLDMSDDEIESVGKQLAIFNSMENNEKIDNLKGIIENECWNVRPKTIRDLTDGVLIDAYSFDKGDEKKLGLFGFFNIELSDKQKVIIVEYSQEGTQYCDSKPIKYGIGARLMMKVNKSKRNA